MDRIIEEMFGPASWLVSDVDQFEVTSSLIIKAFQEGLCLTMSVHELKAMVEEARQCGKMFFKRGDFYHARIIFQHAFLISCLNHLFPKDQLSILNCNMAICSLKLEEPLQAMTFLIAALFDNIEILNDKASRKTSYHLITSSYMMYEFDKALNLISCGLSVRPEFKELKLMKEKILRNKIPQKFPNEIIEQRVAMYSEDTPHQPSDLNFVNIGLLNRYVRSNRKSASLTEAQLVMAKMQHSFQILMSLKNYKDANQMLIDMLYIINMLENRFDERIDDKMFHLYSSRATCLYCMEKYIGAMECCNKAKMYTPHTLEILTLEAKILNKLGRFDEASDAINKCLKIVDPLSVEAVICEEVLFEINFNKDMQTPSEQKGEGFKVTSDHSHGKEKHIHEKIANQNEESSSTPKDKEALEQDKVKFQEIVPETTTNQNKGSSSSLKDEEATEQDEFLMVVCRLCGAVVSAPWEEHVRTTEHLMLLSGVKDLTNGSKPVHVSTQTDCSDDLEAISRDRCTTGTGIVA